MPLGVFVRSGKLELTIYQQEETRAITSAFIGPSGPLTRGVVTEEKLHNLIADLVGDDPTAVRIGKMRSQSRDFFLEHHNKPRLRACKNYPMFHARGKIPEYIPPEDLKEMERILTHGISVLEKAPSDTVFYECHASFKDEEWQGVFCEEGIIMGAFKGVSSQQEDDGPDGPNP